MILVIECHCHCGISIGSVASTLVSSQLVSKNLNNCKEGCSFLITLVFALFIAFIATRVYPLIVFVVNELKSQNNYSPHAGMGRMMTSREGQTPSCGRIRILRATDEADKNRRQDSFIHWLLTTRLRKKSESEGATSCTHSFLDHHVIEKYRNVVEKTDFSHCGNKIR